MSRKLQEPGNRRCRWYRWTRTYGTRLLLLTILVSACSDTRPFRRQGFGARFGEPDRRPAGAEVATFFALGDWGTGKAEQHAVAEALRQQVISLPAGRSHPPFVLGLGDNVYENGLPTGWNNPLALSLLEKTFGQVYDEIRYQGQPVVFHVVPGNHDYAGRAGGKRGFGDVLHQETTAEARYRHWRYYPIDSSLNSDTDDSTNYMQLQGADIRRLTTPEQVPISASDVVAIFAIDTQVLLELYDGNDEELLRRHWQKLEALVAGSSAPWKIIIGHHPIRTHGKHGGFRQWYWYVPPIIIATLIDKAFVKRIQDNDHPAARRLQHDLAEFMLRHKVQIYLAGHEHNLQFLALAERRFQVISGSAAKLSGVTHKDDTLFSQQAYGMVRFDVTGDEMWLEFIAVHPEDGSFDSAALFRLTQ